MFELFDHQSPQDPGPGLFSRPARSTAEQPNPLKCFCNQMINPARNPEFLIQCRDPQCKKYYHKSCLKLPPNFNSSNFDCPSCTLSKCDPLSQVTQTLIPPFLLTIKRKEFSINQEIFKDIKLNENIGLEIRSLKLEDQDHLQCWPTAGELFLNDIRQLEFKPLQPNSSVKKRKDQKFFTRAVRLGLNSICIKFQREASLYKPTESFIAAVYVVKILSCNELVQKVKQKNQRNLEDCKKQILQNFQASGLDINMLSYPLTCVFDMGLLKTPAKGADCTHINCFSLENFVSVCQKNEQRRWTCPICKVKSYDLIVDTYFGQILGTLKSKYSGCNIDFTTASVKIYRDTTFELVVSQDNIDEENEEDDDNFEPKKNFENLIVLDESPEPYRRPFFQSPPENTNPPEFDSNILDDLFQKLYPSSPASRNSLMQIEEEPAGFVNAPANQQQPSIGFDLDFSNCADNNSPILDDYLLVEPTSPLEAPPGNPESSKPVTFSNQSFKLRKDPHDNERRQNNKPLFTRYSQLINNNCSSSSLPKPTLSQLFEKNRLILPPAPVGSQTLVPKSLDASQEKESLHKEAAATHIPNRSIRENQNNQPPVEISKRKACEELKNSTILIINKLIQEFDRKFVLPSFKTRQNNKEVEEEPNFSDKEFSLQMSKKLLLMMKKHTCHHNKAGDLSKLISDTFDNETQKEGLKKFRKNFKKKQSLLELKPAIELTNGNVSTGFELDPICID